jgi:hypothetical protein
LLVKDLARDQGDNPGLWSGFWLGEKASNGPANAFWLILRWQRDGKSAVMTKETAGMFVLEKFTR